MSEFIVHSVPGSPFGRAVLGAPQTNLCAWLKRIEDRPSFVATTWERVAEMAKAA
jgi:hypothetical protein